MKQRFSPSIGIRNLIRTPAWSDLESKLENAGLENAAGDGAGESGETPGIRMNRTPAPAIAGIMTSRTVFAIALFAAAAGFGLPCARAFGESANTDFKQGQAAEAREDYDTAFEDFQKAFNKDPRDARFKIALARVRVTASSVHVTKGHKLEQAGDSQGALGEFLHAAEIDPSNEAAQQEIAHLRQKQGESAPVPEVGLPEPPAEAEQLESIESPPALRPVSNEPLSLHMAEDSKVVYETVGKAAGVNVMFDPDYHSTRIDVDLNNVSLLDALRIVSVMSNTFWRPVTNNTIFVAQNTPSKRRDLDEQAVQTFYLTNAWQQNDLNDVATAIRNVMPTAKAFPVQSQNAIVMRGTPDELLLAQQLIDNLDKPRGEVVVDIAVLEVSKNWEKTLGMQWPSSFGVTLQPNCAATNSCSSSTSSSSTTGSTGSTSAVSPTLYSLAHLNATDFAVTVGSATLNLLLTDNNTKVLQSPRIRATDAQKATMKIGSRIPIATGSYQTGAATALVSSLVNTQFQYQDVGVNIEMTPSVHYDHDVTLKIKIEVSAESGTETISGVTEPIISQRVVDQTIRLREGEASILGGIQNKQEAQNWSGIPGLSAIPIIKYIFGSKDHTIQDDDIVFVVVPHIVRSQELDQANLRVIDTGLGQASIALRYGDNDNGAAPAVVPTARTMPAERPVMGSIPAQSAIEAAPQMLAQLRSDMGSGSGGPTATAQAAVPQPNLPVSPLRRPASHLACLRPTGSRSATDARGGCQPGSQCACNTHGLGLHLPGSRGAQRRSGCDFHCLCSCTTTRKAAIGRRSGRRSPEPRRPAHGTQSREEPPGTVVVSISRPPGTRGVTGTGVVCVLTFQAKAPGQSGWASRAPRSEQRPATSTRADRAGHNCGQVGNRAHESATLHSDPPQRARLNAG
jgi:general secretion pathway protein D